MLEHLQNFSGCLQGECLLTSIILFVLGFVILGFNGAPFFLWAILALSASVGFGAPLWVTAILLVFGIIGTVKPLRTVLVSKGVMTLLEKLKFLPTISETERVAIEAGSTWMEAELFSGKPDFSKMMNQPYPKLTPEEKAFMDNQVMKLCQMINDWEIWKTRRLPDDVWNFIRREKFLGMIIPKEYGGLGFSAYAHSEVIRMVASRSLAVTIYIMVPNSLGPAELLNHYGTDEQKKTMLPRLAVGDEIPCFALTEPTAGSDAGSITADGVIFKGADGKLMMRLNWNKRWITLAAISTLVGLAFRLRDPEKLLGGEVDLGITCAIIPSTTKGVILGERHDPLGVPFHNCPTHGENVEISVDAIIGGVKNVGKGWKMLMECLAAGRGISFPAQSVGNGQLVGRAVSAHALVRQQFGLSIGRFEGVQDALSKVAGYSYILDALRLYTLSALDQGTKPAVITAIAKYHSTELARQISIHGMDIMGGAGISLGPRNLVGHSHIAAPVAITVEGANILTRTLMIFGQGALRAHPYAFAEVKALEAKDAKAFDHAFWGHIGHIVRNGFRSVVLSLTHGWITPYAFGKGSTAIYYRRIAWVSASFAIMADIAMGSLGGKLKIKESITGRFADILSYMYICVAILKRFEEDGAKKEDLPLVHFSMAYIGAETQRAFDGIFQNLQVPGLSWFFRTVIRSWSGLHLVGGDVSDVHVHKIADLVLDDPRIRELLTGGAFKPTKEGEQMKRLDDAVDLFRKVEGIEQKLRRARKEKKITKKPRMQMVADALAAGVINAEEKTALEKWEVVRIDAIQVDSFTESEYHRA
jgi:acyl-CoA dehydrogenase